MIRMRIEDLERMTVEMQRPCDRAPPARRFAGQARSHICFGPVTPVKSPLSALFVPFDIEGGAIALHSSSAIHQGCNPPGTGIIGPKQMWERACPAKRRAGGARSHRRQKSIVRHLEAILQPPDGHLPAITRIPKNHQKIVRLSKVLPPSEPFPTLMLTLTNYPTHRVDARLIVRGKPAL